jgi:hypothetical protein
MSQKSLPLKTAEAPDKAAVVRNIRCAIGGIILVNAKRQNRPGWSGRLCVCVSAAEQVGCGGTI